MSEEPSLGFKPKKKFKLGKFKHSTEEDNKLRSVAPGRRNFKIAAKDKNAVAGQVGEQKASWRGKLKPAIADRRNKRIYGSQGSAMELTPFNDVRTHSGQYASGRRRDSEPGKSIEASSHSPLAFRSSNQAGLRSKHSSRRPANGARSPDVSQEERKISRGRVENAEYLRNSHSKNTKDLSKKLDSSEKKFLGVSSSGPARKRFGNKSSMNDNSELLSDRPKKRKRVIRIDPYDLSNKRLDDGIVTDERPTEDKSSEKKEELSKNAQFRAIQPSKSILSFVEDNLLGRRRLIEIRRAGYNTDLSAPLDNIPFSNSAERERIEENVFRNKLTFFAAAKVSSSFPPPDLPEIAFAGRSNVGKSSLLNALTRQWGVVRTSDKPGLTQTINFFNLGSKLSLVDLPGYGFAYAKEEVKDAWEELVKEYVSSRVGLKRVCLLIDTKWGMKPRDQELIDLMERSQTKYQIVLTKTDTIFPIDVARRAMQIEEMMVSSKSGAGIRSLRTVLSKLGRFVKV